jgi:hypothetical protein
VRSNEQLGAATRVGVRVVAQYARLAMLRALTETVLLLGELTLDEVTEIQVALDEIVTGLMDAALDNRLRFSVLRRADHSVYHRGRREPRGHRRGGFRLARDPHGHRISESDYRIVRSVLGRLSDHHRIRPRGRKSSVTASGETFGVRMAPQRHAHPAG